VSDEEWRDEIVSQSGRKGEWMSESETWKPCSAFKAFATDTILDGAPEQQNLP
jgi:hypothetical protein